MFTWSVTTFARTSSNDLGIQSVRKIHGKVSFVPREMFDPVKANEEKFIL